jgi:hypothetical protein
MYGQSKAMNVMHSHELPPRYGAIRQFIPMKPLVPHSVPVVVNFDVLSYGDYIPVL